MIYLDNAATTLHKPEVCIEAVCSAMRNMGNAARGVNSSSLGASRLLYEARHEFKNFFNAEAEESIVFTSNSTEALNIALFGLVKEGGHVISTEMEHNSVLRPLYKLEREAGVELSFVKYRDGNIDYADFEKMIKPNTVAIVCNHASNLTGHVLDIARIGAIAKKHSLIFIVDASQSAGVLPIDVRAMQVDVLCFTGHKGLYGPQGTGGMVINRNLDIKPFKVGGSGTKSFEKAHPSDYPTRLEAGTLNVHGIAGLLASIGFIKQVGMENIRNKERALALRFIEGVKDIEGIRFYNSMDVKGVAIVSLNIRDIDSSVISDELSFSYDIASRSGSHCAPLLHMALGSREQGAVRFSFSWFNTEEEVDAAIAALREISS